MKRRELFCHVFNAGAASVTAQLLPPGRFASADENPFAVKHSYRPSHADLVVFADYFHDNALIGFEKAARMPRYDHWRDKTFSIGDIFDLKDANVLTAEDIQDMMCVWVPRLARRRRIPIVTVAWTESDDTKVSAVTIVGRTVVREPNEPVLDYVRLEASRYLA